MHGNKGKKFTEEHKRKIAFSNIGKIHLFKNEETQLKSLSKLRNFRRKSLSL
jgi:hypothetical protein